MASKHVILNLFQDLIGYKIFDNNPIYDYKLNKRKL